jgi:hypothetical protein
MVSALFSDYSTIVHHREQFLICSSLVFKIPGSQVESNSGVSERMQIGYAIGLVFLSMEVLPIGQKRSILHSWPRLKVQAQDALRRSL